jgi:hypothetical protein
MSIEGLGIWGGCSAPVSTERWPGYISVLLALEMLEA